MQTGNNIKIWKIDTAEIIKEFTEKISNLLQDKTQHKSIMYIWMKIY